MPPRSVLSMILTIAAVTGACSSAERPAEQARPPVPVRVASVEQKSMPVSVEAVGSVEPLTSVSVQPRVAGELLSVHFEEGEEVERGALLATIDPQPYRLALDEANAVLARDKALLDQAEVDAKRYAELAAKDYISREQYQQAKSKAASLAATVTADAAAVETARLQLAYTTIRAPISGRTGRRLLDPGNLVRANDSELVKVLQVRPIYVTFSVPEMYLSLVREAAAKSAPAQVMPDGCTDPAACPTQVRTGELVFVDNNIDRSSGTLLLRAKLDNEDGALWPGQFVRVVLQLTDDPGAIVAPAIALQEGQEGPYVFVVGPDRTVKARSVVIARRTDREVVIASGLAAGETVVTDGQLRLVPGARVTLKGPAAAANGSAAAAN